MRILLALAIGACAITSLAMSGSASAAAAKSVSEDARFTAFGDRIVDALLKSDPVGATQLGDHRYDALLPDVSASGRAARRAFAQRSLAELARFHSGRLTREHQVDAILLKEQFDYVIFSTDRLQ